MNNIYREEDDDKSKENHVKFDFLKKPKSNKNFLFDKNKNQSAFEKQSTKIHKEINKYRTQGSSIWFGIMLLSFALVPFFNLYLFYVQSFTLNKGQKIGEVTTTKLLKDNANNFNNFYVVIVGYSMIIVAFLYNSLTMGKLKETLTLYMQLDSLLLAGLVSNISYITLHLQYFCGDLITGRFICVEQDVAIMVLCPLTNIVMLGKFRCAIVFVRWERWQVIGFKTFVFICTIIYFGVGFIFLFGNDSGSNVYDFYLNRIKTFLTSYYDYNFNYTTDILQDIQFFSAGTLYLGKIQNCILFYLSANFNLFFELTDSISKFDGTFEMETHYTIGAECRRKTEEINKGIFKWKEES